MREYRAYVTDNRPGSPFIGQCVEVARDLDMTAAQDLIDSIHATQTDLSYHYACAWPTGKLGHWMAHDTGGVKTKSLSDHENIRNDTDAKDRSLEGDREECRKPQDVLRNRAPKQTLPKETDGLHLPTSRP